MFRYFPKYPLSIITLIALLSACSTLNKAPKIANPDWELSAKISARQQTGKTENAIIHWQKKGSTSRLRCFNSFSQPLFNLLITPEYARMDIADGSVKEARSAEKLMRSTLGWSMPTEVVELWLNGQLSGEESSIQRSDGHLSHFTFKQWQVSLSRYRQFEQNTLPSKIILKNDQLTIIIVIKDYEQFPRNETALSR